MSVKIDNGYRWVAPASPGCPFELAELLHEALAPRLEELAFAAVVARATEVLDGVRPCEPGRPPLSQALGEFRAAASEVERTGRRDPAHDFAADAWLLRHPGDAAAVLVVLACEQDVAAALAAVPGLAPWPYWDNSDAPDDVTPDEWAARGEVWRAAWGSGPLGRHALRVQVSDPLLRLRFDDRDALVAAVPPQRRRARRVLECQVASNLGLPEGASPAEVFAAYDEALRAALDEPGRLAGIEASLRPLDPSVLWEVPR